MNSYLITGNPSTMVVSIDSHLDFRNVPEFLAECQELLLENHPLIILIREEARVDYAGLKSLRVLQAHAHWMNSSSIVVVATGEHVRSTIALVGLDRIVEVQDDLNAAWASLQRPQDNLS